MTMTAEESNTITLYTWVGEGENRGQSMAEAARQWVETIGLQTWLGWFEPYPGLRLDGKPGRAEDFEPWTTSWPDPAKTPPLAEIRIGGRLPGGRLGGCHLVQDEDGPVRCFAFSECDFKDSLPIPSVQEPKPYPALQRRDATARFFANAPNWLRQKRKLEMVEYWTGERLLAWLVVEKRG